MTWRNELPPGVEHGQRRPVRRFRVKHERDPLRLRAPVGSRLQSSCTRWATSSTGSTPKARPAPRSSIQHLRQHGDDYDYCLFFSYRYYHALLRRARRRHRARFWSRPPNGTRRSVSSIFQPLFRGVRALMYNSPEERAMIHAVSGNQPMSRRRRRHRIGCAAEPAAGAVPPEATTSAARSRSTSAGSIKNKGCTELFEFFQGYLQDPAGKLSLVLIGNSLLPIPDASAHPASGLPRRYRQVRRDGGGAIC